MRLLNHHFNQCVAGHMKLFLWRLHQLKWKLMIVIMNFLDQVTTVPHRVTRMRTTLEWYSNPVLKVMLLDNNEPTSYGEVMVGPNSDKWLEAIKIRERIHV